MQCTWLKVDLAFRFLRLLGGVFGRGLLEPSGFLYGQVCVAYQTHAALTDTNGVLLFGAVPSLGDGYESWKFPPVSTRGTPLVEGEWMEQGIT